MSAEPASNRMSIVTRTVLLTAAIAAIAVVVAGLVSYPLVRSAAETQTRADLVRLADLTATALDGRYDDRDGDGRRDEPLPRSLIAALQAEQITGYLVAPGAAAPPGVSQEVLDAALGGSSVSSEGRTDDGMVLVEARPLADGSAVILEQPFTVVGVEAGRRRASDSRSPCCWACSSPCRSGTGRRCD